MNSLRAYEISEVVTEAATTSTICPSPTSTICPSPASTIVTSQNICSPSSPLAVGLSTSTSILGLCFLATIGIHLWKSRRNIVPTPGSRS